MNGLAIENAKWMGNLLDPLSDRDGPFHSRDSRTYEAASGIV